MVHSLNQKSNLSSWSWQSLSEIYRILGGQLKEYQGIKKRLNVPRSVDIEFSDQKNVFIIRFWRDVTKINRQLVALDVEIARRNSLLGVME